jgi:hypothetical protein
MNRDDLIKLRQEELEKEEINKKLVLEELSQSLKSEDLFFLDQLCGYDNHDNQDNNLDSDIIELLNDSDNIVDKKIDNNLDRDFDKNLDDDLDRDLEDMIFDIIDL